MLELLSDWRLLKDYSMETIYHCMVVFLPVLLEK
jgi:hypothetical protein